jgi:hypothetical protein
MLRSAGMAIHAWSILADITNDTQWRDLRVPVSCRWCLSMLSTLCRTVHVLVAASQTDQWAGPDGISAIQRSSLSFYVNISTVADARWTLQKVDRSQTMTSWVTKVFPTEHSREWRLLT